MNHQQHRPEEAEERIVVGEHGHLLVVVGRSVIGGRWPRSAAAPVLAAVDAVPRPGGGAGHDRGRDGSSCQWSTSQHVVSPCRGVGSVQPAAASAASAASIRSWGMREPSISTPPEFAHRLDERVAHTSSQISRAADEFGSSSAAAYSMSSSLMRPPTSPSRALNRATSSWSSNSTALDVAVGVLGDEDEVEDADRAALDQLAELGGDLAVELVAGEPDDDVLDRTDRHRDASLSCGPLTPERRRWPRSCRTYGR